MSVNVWRDNGGVALPYVSGNFSSLRSGDMVVTELTVNNLEVDGEIRLNGDVGVDGQVIKKVGGDPEWANIQIGDISPGLSNYVAAVNNAGTAVEFTERLTVLTLQFKADVNQSSLNYYSQPAALICPLTYEDGSVSSVQCIAERVGRIVTLKFPRMTVNHAAVVNPYRLVTGIPLFLRPNYGTDVVTFNDCTGGFVACTQTNSVGPVTTRVGGVAYVTNGGDVYVFTNVNRTVPASGVLESNPFTIVYSIV